MLLQKRIELFAKQIGHRRSISKRRNARAHLSADLPTSPTRLTDPNQIKSLARAKQPLAIWMKTNRPSPFPRHRKFSGPRTPVNDPDFPWRHVNEFSDATAVEQ